MPNLCQFLSQNDSACDQKATFSVIHEPTGVEMYLCPDHADEVFDAYVTIVPSKMNTRMLPFIISPLR